MSEPVDKLWEEYKRPFEQFDDLTLARWLAQTLGQFEGRLWRMSHPLVSAYRAAAELGNDRDIWHKRIATIPPAFTPAECCGAPLLPLFTRDILNTGLVCQHCGATAIEYDEIANVLKEKIEPWAEDYADLHAVAHFDEGQMRSAGDYDQVFEKAASQAEEQLSIAAREILPGFLDYFPALVWEDQDECLEVEPKDIVTW